MTIRHLMLADIRRWFGGVQPSRMAVTWALVVYGGLRAVLLMRVQAAMWERGWLHLAQLVYSLNSLLHGAEFLPGCQIGPGLLIRHPVGVVVGQAAVLGSDCTLLQGVTLGERYADGSGDHRYPTLEAGVAIGANAVVLGGVTLGRNSRVGAGAVVSVDVPEGALAVGNPARVLPARTDNE
jgi:serine O-acetyltransferase